MKNIIKIKNRNLLLIGFVICCWNLVDARSNCLNVDNLTTSINIEHLGTCVEEPLEYVDSKNENPYWQGGFVRKLKAQISSLVVISDLCTHSVVERKENVQHTTLIDKSFPVFNPNRDKPINYSWENLPLTPKQAEAAQAKSKSICEAYTLEEAKNEFNESLY